jgi:hypothetical protein
MPSTPIVSLDPQSLQGMTIQEATQRGETAGYYVLTFGP